MAGTLRCHLGSCLSAEDGCIYSMPKAEMHGMVVIDRMPVAHRGTSELGREGVEVGTKKRIT